MKKLILLVLFFLLFAGCTASEYQVMFNSNGGTSIETQIVEKKHSVIKPVDPVKEGYEFQGWELNDKEYTFKEKVNKDIVLDAIWKESDTLKTYKVTYKIDDKTTEEIIVVGQCASEPTRPIKNGYTFLGWYIDGEESPYIFDKLINEDLNLVAKFKKDDNESSSEYSNQIIFVTELEATSSMTELERNETSKIEIKIEPENATNQTVKFTTSNRRIITVDDYGLVKAIRPGEATITIETTDTSGIQKTIKFNVVNKKEPINPNN